MSGLLIKWAILTAAFIVTAKLLGGMDVSGGFFGYIWVAALFGIVNTILGTFLRIITLPLTVVTLGLFLIVINAAMLELTDAITDNLSIDDFFWTAIWASIIMSISTVVLDVALRAVREKN